MSASLRMTGSDGRFSLAAISLPIPFGPRHDRAALRRSRVAHDELRGSHQLAQVDLDRSDVTRTQCKEIVDGLNVYAVEPDDRHTDVEAARKEDLIAEHLHALHLGEHTAERP